MSRRAASALIPAIFALVLIEALVASALLFALRELAATRAHRSTVHARLAAESALAAAIADWTAARAAELRPLEAADLAADQPLATTARFTSQVVRIDVERYLLRGFGFAENPDSARAAATAMLWTRPRAPFLELARAALTAAGPVTVQDGGVVVGELALPTADCPHGFTGVPIPAAPAPAMLVPDPANVVLAAGSTLLGDALVDPAPLGDPIGALQILFNNDIAAAADKHAATAVFLAPVTDAGLCLVGAPDNWGEPARIAHPCHRFTPLIHATADLLITGGTGHGILVVEGALTIAAGARFDGLIFTAGPVQLGTGATVRGALHAGAHQVTVAGQLHYDRCAITRVLAHAPALATIGAPGARKRLPAW